MRVTAYNKDEMVHGELAWLLGDEIKLSRWSQLPKFCAHLQNKCTKATHEDIVQKSSNLLIKTLISAVTDTGDSENKANVLRFIAEQFSLLNATQKRYSAGCLLIALIPWVVTGSSPVRLSRRYTNTNTAVG